MENVVKANQDSGNSFLRRAMRSANKITGAILSRRPEAKKIELSGTLQKLKP